MLQSNRAPGQLNYIKGTKERSGRLGNIVRKVVKDT